MSKNNVLIDKPGSKLSDLEGDQVLRDVHDYPGHTLRVRDTIVINDEHYDNFKVTYDLNNNPTEVCYFVGITPHLTTIGFSGDTAGSLNNTYFFIYEPRSNDRFHIWYNVDGTGVDPAPSNSTGIEVPIVSNDPATVVTSATEIVLAGYPTLFKTIRQNSTLKIETIRLGEASNTIDATTGFLITNDPGTSEQTNKVQIDYVNGNPIWEGQELKGHVLNIFTGKFEKILEVDVNVDADTGDNMAISGHSTGTNIVVEDDYVKADLDTAAYTEVLTYTATADMDMRALKIKADTFGAFRLKVNGTTRDYYQTSQMDRNASFKFLEDEAVSTGDIVSIEFLPDRLLVNNYNFFMRIEAYLT